MNISLLLLLLALSVSNCVDRTKFKTCDQSGFCKRNRRYKDFEIPTYHIKPESLSISENDGVVQCMILNTKSNIHLSMKVRNVEHGILRVTIVEESPLYARYIPTYALNGEPVGRNLSLISKNSLKAEFRLSQSLKMIIHFNPILIEVMKNGKVIVSVNSRRLLNFEHYRSKPLPEGPENNHESDKAEESPDDSDGALQNTDQSQLEQETADGMWEESFQSHQDSKKRGPSAVSVDVGFPGSFHVYGIPEHAGSFALKDTVSSEPYRLFNLDVFEYEIDDFMALYGSVPFVVSHSATHGTAGVFWHNAAETWVDIKSQPDSGIVSTVSHFLSGSDDRNVEKSVRWISESGALDLFVLTGPSPADVMAQYKSLTGATQLPPLFSLGYHQCRWNYNDQQDVDSVHRHMDEYDLPFDVIWLDIEHTDGKKYFTWDSHKFPSSVDMINKLAAYGRKMVAIVDPHIKRESGYFFHDDAVNNGYYVKDRDGKDFEGWCWPGSSGYPDFFNPAVQQYWASRFQLDNYQGSTLDLFTWNDMNEPSVFSGPEVTMHKDAQHVGGWEHRDVHNEYGMLVPMFTAHGQVQRSGGKLRPFVLTRAAFAGSQRYGAKWTGDNAAEWSHLRASIPMLLSSSVAGISFIGADVGGFFGNPDQELLTRWYQAAAFQPFFRAHAHIDTRRREPYLFDTTTVDRIRAALRLRYRYLPLWYTLFYENEMNGMPPMRPMWMVFPDDPSGYSVDNQYMIGDSLLVHPQTEQGANSVDVFFPAQDGLLWYNVQDPTSVHALGVRSVATSMDTIPVFQRSGTIVPRQDRPRRSSAAMLHDPYTLVVALDGNQTASGRLFVDDGRSFDYRHHDQFALLQFSMSSGNNGGTSVLQSRRIAGGDYNTDRWIERVIVLGMKRSPRSVQLEVGGRHSPLDFKLNAKTGELIVRKPAVNVLEEWSVVFH